MVEILAHVTSDGYLLSAEYANTAVFADSYWSDYYDSDTCNMEVETISMEVDYNVALELVLMGTSGQTISDGYEAQQIAITNKLPDYLS